MGRLCERAYSTFTEEARRRGIDYEKRADDEPVIISDGDRVLQIISNLLSNAFRWTPDGGRIDVALTSDNGAVAVDVADTGPGIRAEERERIFRPFWSRDGRGTGLGLPIARELALALGGRIELESEVGKGSRFRLDPAGPALLAPKRPPPWRGPPASPAATLVGRGARVCNAFVPIACRLGSRRCRCRSHAPSSSRWSRAAARSAALWVALRPRQWTKNLLLFAGIVFAAELGDASRWARALTAFAVYCAASSAAYLLNDLQGRGRRPPASGQAAPAPRPRRAVAYGLRSWRRACWSRPPWPGRRCSGGPRSAFLLAFLALQVAYTLRLKQIVLIDVMAISALFVIRAAAGADAVDVPISPWLLVCTALLALFLALGKRRGELVLVGDAKPSRAALEGYSLAARRPARRHRRLVDGRLLLGLRDHGARDARACRDDPVRRLRHLPLPPAAAPRRPAARSPRTCSSPTCRSSSRSRSGRRRCAVVAGREPRRRAGARRCRSGRLRAVPAARRRPASPTRSARPRARDRRCARAALRAGRPRDARAVGSPG